MEQLKTIIENAFEHRAEITPATTDIQLSDAINQVINQLDKGQLRVADKIDGQWITHQWLKKSCATLFSYQ